MGSLNEPLTATNLLLSRRKKNQCFLLVLKYENNAKNEINII